MFINSSSTGLFSGNLFSGSTSFSQSEGGSSSTDTWQSTGLTLNIADSVSISSSASGSTMDFDLSNIYSMVSDVQKAMYSVDPSEIDDDQLAGYQNTLDLANQELQAYSKYSSTTQYQLASSLLDEAIDNVGALQDTGLPENIDTVALDTTLTDMETSLTTSFDDLEAILDLVALVEGSGNFADQYLVDNLRDGLDEYINDPNVSAETVTTLQDAKSALDAELAVIDAAVAEGASFEDAFLDSLTSLQSIQGDIQTAIQDPALTRSDQEALTTVDAPFEAALGGGSSKLELAQVRNNLLEVLEEYDAFFADGENSQHVKDAVQNTYDALPGLIDSMTDDLINSTDMEAAVQSAHDATLALHTAGTDDVNTSGLSESNTDKAMELVNGLQSAASQVDQMLSITDPELVNTYTDNDQTQPDVVTFDDGSYLTIYKSNGIEGDASTYLTAQKFDADGNKEGDEFTLGITTSVNTQKDYAVELLEDGSLIATWQGSGNSGLFSQRLDSDGNALSAATQLSGKKFTSVDVTALEGGGYAVSYTDDSTNGDSNIQLQLFDSSDTLIGSEITVAGESGDQENAQVIALDGGGFAVAYTDTTGSDGDGSGATMKIYDAAGVQQGGSIQLNQTTVGDQEIADITKLTDGNIMVAYTSDDGSTRDLYIREFDATGSAVGDEIQVNTDGGSVDSVSMTATNNGEFAVAYSEGQNIYLQRYTGDNEEMGTVTQVVVDETANKTSTLDLSANGSGLVLAYDQHTGVNKNVYAQRITLLNEGLGLESGTGEQSLDQSISHQSEVIKTILAEPVVSQEDAQETYNRLNNLMGDLDRFEVDAEEQDILDAVKAAVQAEMDALSGFINTTNLSSTEQSSSLMEIGHDLQKVLDLLSRAPVEDGAQISTKPTVQNSSAGSSFGAKGSRGGGGRGATMLEKLSASSEQDVKFEVRKGFAGSDQLVKRDSKKSALAGLAKNNEAINRYTKSAIEGRKASQIAEKRAAASSNNDPMQGLFDAMKKVTRNAIQTAETASSLYTTTTTTTTTTSSQDGKGRRKIGGVRRKGGI